MKNIIFLLIILISIISCQNENDNENQEKFFNPVNLGKLDLANIDGFWNNDSNIDTSFNGGGGVLFESHLGFIEGIGLYNEDKAVWISVFTTKDTAINAMESRINNVAAVIEKGTSDEIKGTWWVLKNSSVFVNKCNTIIEVVVFGNKNEEDGILYSTANELARRVDNLSK